MADAAPAGPSGLPLLDVLEQLPVALLRNSFWPHLPPDACFSCRCASPRFLRLASQLQRVFRYTYHGNVPSEEEVRQQCACLSRHEHLEVLHLFLPTSEAHSAAGLRAGGAACLRVVELRITDGYGLTATTGDALALACPTLRTLKLEYVQGLDPSFFAALQALECVTQVDLMATSISAAAVGALAALPYLRTLRVHADEGGAVDAPDMPVLAALTALRELHLTADCGEATTPLLSVVATLTQLTSLKLSTTVGRERSAVHEAESNVVLARLGALQHLVSLNIVDMFSCVDAAGFAGLRQLSRLTSLHVGSLDAPSSAGAGGGGALPQLRELRLARPVGAAELLNALRLLSPLQHLEEVRIDVRLGSSLETEAAQAAALAAAGGSAAAAAAAGLAALRQAVQLLSAAPQLRKRFITLFGSHSSTDKFELGDTMAVLQALQPPLERLAVRSCSAPQLEGLSAALSRCASVEALHMNESLVEDATLLDLALHGGQLSHFRVMCSGGASPTLAMAFIAARRQRVSLSWPGLKPSEVATMRAAIRVLGKEEVVNLVTA